MPTQLDQLFEPEMYNDSRESKPFPPHKLDQEIAPAIAAAGAAVGALGYTVIKDIWNSGSSSDVSWKLNMMEGTKFPNNNKEKYGKKSGYKSANPIRVKGSLLQGFWIKDEISATFRIYFEYNKYSVSSIYVENIGANDAVAWDLKVTQDIRPIRQIYYANNLPVAAVDVKFHYHFHKTFFGSEILLMTYRLYGNGYWERTQYEWT